MSASGPAMNAPAPTTAANLAAELEALHASSFGWAMACCRRNADHASDVLQQAYAKVLAGQARYEGRSSVRTWFFGVIRMTAREHQRWAWLRWAGVVEPEPARPDALAEATQDARALARALTQLAARQRECLHLVFYEGISINEAAQVMGISAGSARQHYERAKKNLRAILAKEGVEHG